MRLLKCNSTGDISLTGYLHDSERPKYAILSHTWGEDGHEVSLDDLEQGTGFEKPGYEKLRFCAHQAQQDGLEYFWVDTCCIRKSDSAELSEAITSMFRWYRSADKCYVYLSDVPDLKRNHDGSKRRTEKEAIHNSRWFARGWTLQELLAPTSVAFFSREKKYLGTKHTLADLIQETTQIPTALLLGSQELATISIQERISWVKRRSTKRPEDKTYCLLGILGVSMPSNYGEGEDALERLTEALLRKYPSRDVFGLESFYQVRSTGRSEKGINSGSGEDISAQSRRQMILDSLKFEQMDSRRSTIKREHSSTCSWLLKHHVYKTWKDSDHLRQHGGLLWIKGKPGSGKSTLMRFAHAKATRAHSDDEIVISFFFNARGDHLEKTTVGTYRSLLSQLLKKAPDLQQLLDEHISSDMIEDYMKEWSTEWLCDLMTNVVTGLGKRQCTCYIDALDECDEHEIREMVHFFEELGQTASQNGVQLHICFASRHYPTIDTPHGLKMTIEDEQGHSDDLTRYIQNRLRAGTGSSIEQLRMRVKEKAMGVFMWVVLVVDILNEEFERGFLPAVERRFDEIPAGLSNLFRDILQRDRNNIADFRLCLQWVLFSSRPLRREEFYFAMIAGLEPTKISRWDANNVEHAYMDKYVLSSSKGLAELTKSSKPTVQFIHESVRDFLTKEGGFRQIWFEDTNDSNSSESACHDQLKRCCATQLEADLSSLLPSNGSLPVAKSIEAKTLREAANMLHPFLEYASQNVFYHANEAAKHITQNTFLDSFPLRNWINVFNIFELYQVRRYTLDASFLYVFADSNCPQLLQTFDCRAAVSSVSAERYGSPVLAALVNGHINCVRALLQNCDSSRLEQTMSVLKIHRNFSLRKGRTLLSWAIHQGHPAFAEMILTSPGFQLQAPETRAENVLYAASDRGYEKVVEMLLAKGADANAQGGEYGNALQAASCGGYKKVVEMLLAKGADANAQGGYYGNALQAALIGGYEKVVEMLLAKGADANAQGGPYGNALQAALIGGYEKIVEILLAKGADANAQGGPYGNALQAASHRGHEKIVGMLLAKGADANAQGGEYGNALQAALHGGHEKIVEMLLAKGADANAQGGGYGNALQAASHRGYEKIVEMLLAKGADANAQGGWYGNALQAASHRGHEKVVEMLLAKGADANAQGGWYGNALQAASHRGHEKVVEILLAKGADANAQGGWYGNALQAASRRGYEKVVEILLAKGADANAPGGEYGNALQAASDGGHEKVVEILLAKGADANAQGGQYGNALQAASRRGYEKVVEILLAKGADANAPRGEYGNALQAALCRGYEKIVEMLINARARTREGRADIVNL